MIRICGPKSPAPTDAWRVVNVTSRAADWGHTLSPFRMLRPPLKLYGDEVAHCVENAWQFAKVYKEHVDRYERPSKAYWQWARQGWLDDARAHRYPMGKGRKPLYSFWNGQMLDYVTARKRIYVPLYREAVLRSPGFPLIVAAYREAESVGRDLWLWDFDGYDHVQQKMTLKAVLNNPRRSMGHAFVIAMMLEKLKKVGWLP